MRRVFLGKSLTARIDWSTLETEPGSFVDRDAKQWHTDLLFSVRLAGRMVYLYLLLEHQSTVDPLMPLRMLTYETRAWMSLREPGKRLPVIIPLVLHHGARGWTASRHFVDLLDADEELLELVGPYVPGFESQLFGHVAGAFTGAQRAHDGFFRAADGGTLLLDEIGDLPSSVQPKLLRVLEERAVIPVGATTPIPVDIRLVAATHRDLEAGIDECWFRGDLYSRLSDLVLATPPLRERREDVLPLLRHALRDDRPFEPELRDALLNARWRFNVRELFKVARELVVRAGDAERFELRSVKARLSRAVDPIPNDASTPEPERRPEAAPTRDELIALLEQCRGNISHVAKAARRSRKQIYRYLHEHEIDPAAYRPAKRS